jgi:hypothetical protein
MFAIDYAPPFRFDRSPTPIMSLFFRACLLLCSVLRWVCFRSNGGIIEKCDQIRWDGRINGNLFMLLVY